MSLQARLAFPLMTIVLVFSIYLGFRDYRHDKEAFLSSIDEKLYMAAVFTHEVITDQYHDRIIDQKSLSDEEFEFIVRKFNALCQDLHLEYLWSLILIDGEVRFTSSTTTSKDFDNGDHALFFEKHSNPDAYNLVFESMEPQMEIIEDKWGVIRSILVPHQDSFGRKYLIGASMKTSLIDTVLWNTLRTTFLSSLFLGIAGSVVVYFFSKSLISPIAGLTKVANAIANGRPFKKIPKRGGRELKLLSDSIEQMARNIEQSIKDLELARDEAEHASQVKGNFLSIMSHELRTPLNIILGNAQNLQETDELNQDLRFSVKEIVDSGWQLLNLIDQILLLTIIEAGELKISKHEFGVHELIDRHLERIKVYATSKKLQFVRYVGIDVPELFYGDESHISRIIECLIDNAVKFTEEGVITVSAFCKSTDYLVIMVEDNGIGISEENKSKVFDAFTSLDDSISRRNTGLGVGLTIAQKMALSMGAKIIMESALNKGSRFSLYLPLNCKGEPQI